LKDFYGIKSEVGDPLEALLMIEYIYFKFAKERKKFKIKNKSMIDEETLELYKDKLNPEFYTKIKEQLFAIPTKVLRIFEKRLPEVLIFKIKKEGVLTSELWKQIKPFFGE